MWVNSCRLPKPHLSVLKRTSGHGTNATQKLDQSCIRVSHPGTPVQDCGAQLEDLFILVKRASQFGNSEAMACLHPSSKASRIFKAFKGARFLMPKLDFGISSFGGGCCSAGLMQPSLETFSGLGDEVETSARTRVLIEGIGCLRPV